MWGRSAVILVVAVLLVGCGGDAGVSEFTGATSCVEVDSTWSGPALGGEPGTSAEATWDCDYTMSDERASGSGPVVFSIDLSVDGETTVAAISGTAVISNEGGTWEGQVSGTSTWTTANPLHVHDLEGWFLGTGDYEGLRLIVHNVGTDFPWTSTGRIESAE